MESKLLPFLTSDLAGIGGHIKVEPEDFVVEEIPAYQPSGDGQHLFLWIEKRDLPHDALIRILAKSLDVPQAEIGVAGIKDRRAVSRQFVSVPRSCEEKVFALMQGGSKTTESESDSALDSARLPVSERRDYLEEDERVIESERNRRAVPFCILSSKPHGNKLRTGHLRGNRFSIVVRDVHENGLNIANEVATRLTAAGFPNYYGEQRFGHDGETLNLGIDLLAGRKQPRDIPFAKRKFLLRLAVSAVQSELFNRSLAQRMSDGLLQTVLPGDVMEVVESGGRFVVEDVSREQERLNRGEIVVTGPMFGVKMLNPQSAAAEREAKLLLESGLTIEQFQQFSQLMQGTRRPYVIRPGELKVSGDDRLIKLEFALPSGVYATTLLREIMKPPQAV